ncbi:hypothetical protein GOBAR_DD05406 [Gossypium barbadense]|nr:hypothetical protein GOBAR_DD05406 [Gossypium barbadense]
MDTSTVHLAMAALVGASLVAVSAYYMHRKTLNQLLEFAKTVEREREDISEGEESPQPQHSKKRRGQHFRWKGNGYYRRGSASLPDVTVISGGFDGEEKRNGPVNVDGIPPGLPRLHTLPEAKRSGSLIRPTSPKSPSASAFESIEGSDDEDNITDSSKLDITYLHTNGNAGPNLPDHINANGEAMQIAASSMIRSHSIAGDLHGVQPDPIAADILRKEPEQETFARLKISPSEVPSPDEVEVYVVLQECLEMRKRYVFKEAVAPWEKEVISDPSTPKPNPDPFFYAPEGKSDRRELFPVADATTFFTDLHHILRVIAAGNIRTLCFHRLNLLEQKFNLHLMLNADREFLAQKSAPHRDFYNVRKVDTHVHHSACMNQKHLLRFIKSKLRKEPDEYDLNVDLLDVHADKSTFHRFDKWGCKYAYPFLQHYFEMQDGVIHVYDNKDPDCFSAKAVEVVHMKRLFFPQKLFTGFFFVQVVIFRDGTYLTLKEVFESLDLTGYDLNVDLLDVHADKSTFHRFDKFNLKYNPCGQSRLREIFLKQDNLIQGRFLGELTKEVFSDLAASKYQMAEYRISIYGRKQSEWDQLASWIVNNDLYSENVVWLIQIPRLYNVYKEMGIVTSFQNILDNIFIPLFEVTVDPDSHPQLHVFLKQVVGLDLVDDESKPERRPTKHMPTPDQWTNVFNPAFSYYAYYCYANLYTLNKLRESKGMTTIKFRPHSGEAGDIDHLAATFLTAHNIAHGINLRKSPVLQYLYYLAQIGLAMSPLSNNSLFLDYHRNPFPMFFLRGLNVSLSTDDPLQIHLTKEPLVEEYSIAASVWKLSACDLCEIARNSVYQSGFSHALKSHWIGKEYYKRGPNGNEIQRTNVPHIRLEFRDRIWREEMQLVYLGKAITPEEVEK